MILLAASVSGVVLLLNMLATRYGLIDSKLRHVLLVKNYIPLKVMR